MRNRMTAMVLENDICVLATAGGDRPHCSLMAYVADDTGETLYLATPSHSRKFRNLGQNPFVSLLIDTRKEHAREATRALTVSGTCEAVKDPEEKAGALARLRAAHPPLSAFLEDPKIEILRVRADSFLLLDGVSDAHFVEVG